MNIEAAIDSILGASIAADFIARMKADKSVACDGYLHWSVWAAMIAAKHNDDPQAIAVVRAWDDAHPERRPFNDLSALAQRRWVKLATGVSR